MHTLAPQLLTDLTRLPEIYALRVACWEQSPGVKYVNSELFPDGWHDALDTHPMARYWVVEDSGRIVAAARVVVLDRIEEIGQDFSCFTLPEERPYGYLSRLVILPNYRRRGMADVFDQIRMRFLQEASVAFALASPIPKRLPPLLALGWTYLGDASFYYGVLSPSQLPGPFCMWQPKGTFQTKTPMTYS